MCAMMSYRRGYSSDDSTFLCCFLCYLAPEVIVTVFRAMFTLVFKSFPFMILGRLKIEVTVIRDLMLPLSL